MNRLLGMTHYNFFSGHKSEVHRDLGWSFHANVNLKNGGLQVGKYRPSMMNRHRGMMTLLHYVAYITK